MDCKCTPARIQISADRAVHPTVLRKCVLTHSELPSLIDDCCIAGLMSSISDQIYAALAYHVSSEVANSKRIRQVSFWGIQRGAEVLLDTLRNVVDPAHAQLLASL